MDSSLVEKLEQLQKEYDKKKRKLKKCQRAASAKAHVKKKLQEQEELETDDSFTRDVEDEPCLENSISCHGDHKINSQSTIQSSSMLNEKGKSEMCNSPIPNNTIKTTSLQNSNKVPQISCEQTIQKSVVEHHKPQPVIETLKCTDENSQKLKVKSSKKLAKYMKKKHIFKIKNVEIVEVDACIEPCVSTDTEFSRQNQEKLKDGHGSITSDLKAVHIVTDQSSELADNIDINNDKNGLDVLDNCNVKLDMDTNSETDQLNETDTHDSCKNVRDVNCIANLPNVYSTPILEGSDKSSVCSEDLFGSQASDNSFVKSKTRRGRRKSTGGSRQRQSSRLAELSSQDNSSASSQNGSGVNSPVYMDGSMAKMKKNVIISSMFQCLIDEGKRRKNEDFDIPCGYKVDLSGNSDITDQETVTSLNSNVNSGSISQESTSVGLTESGLSVQVDGCDKESCVKNDQVYKVEIVPTNHTDDEGNQSPTLFESQPLTNTQHTQNVNENSDSVILGCEKDTFKDIFENGKTNLERANVINTDIIDADNVADSETTDNTSEIYLDQTSSFQIIGGDTLLALEAITLLHEEVESVYVACLCTTALKMYRWENESWHCIGSNKHSTMLRKKSVFSMYSWSGIPDVHLVLVQTKSDSTSLTHYTLMETEIKQTQLNPLESKGICTCSLTCGQFMVARWTGSRTELTKYTLDMISGQWIQTDLETCDNKITAVAKVKHKPMAVAGFSSQGILNIWNHECGFLLSSVDLSDVCPRDFLCPEIYHEEGFLFLPLLNKKKSLEAGSIVVVNPQMGTSETLVSLQAKHHTWTGCSKGLLLKDDILVARETNGQFSVLDLYTGRLLATLDDTNITCLSCTSAFLFLAHKQCTHVYTCS